MDNEISAEYKRAIEENEVNFQLVPPHDHRRNIAEKAIQVFKDHFVSVLCGADVNFPLQLWDRILPQAEHQLNLLRKSRVNPSKSSFEVMNGKHDYNANPFAPLGVAVEMHVMPNKRRTWESHTKAGYYLGTSWDHYRCHEIWISDTRSTRIGQTVFFKHKYLTQPAVTSADAIVLASEDLCQALKGLPPVKGDTRTAVELLMDIFKGVGSEEETETDVQRKRMTEASTERIISDEAENDAEIEGIWTVPDELELADDDLRTTKSVQIVYPSNHLSPIQDPNSPRQEKVNPDEKRGKNWRPNLIEDDNAPI